MEREKIALGGHVLVLPPLGYLDFAALASQARDRDRLGRSAEGGVLVRRAVRDARPSTEWVDTVEAGANRLVDDDPEALVDAVTTARMPSTARSCTETVRPRSGSLRPSLCFSHDRAHRGSFGPAAPARTWDVAIVGAGYVGVPLAHTFALAGRSVLLVDVLQDVVDALNRGESHIEDVRADGLGPLVPPAGSPRRPTTTACATRTRS